MGHAPSIMDYSRFNYVAQPEDHIPVEDLVPNVGPYDVFATKWGYTPVAGAKSPEERKAEAGRMGARTGQNSVAALLHRRRGRIGFR